MAVAIVPEFIWVKPGELHPNPWNPNVMDPEQYAKAVESIRRFGFIDPITVRHNDGYEIIDGENRWRAAVDERLKQVPVTDLGIVPDHVAQQLTIVLNELRGQPDPGKLGALLRQLSAEMSIDQLTATLPYSREAFSQLTGMPVLDWSKMPTLEPQPQRQVEGWVERVYRMPVAAAQQLDGYLRLWREQGGEGPEWQAILEFAEVALTE